MSSESKVDAFAHAFSAAAADARATTAESGTDEDVLAALRSGDHNGALSLCARQHVASVGRLCMALLGSQAAADDAVQDTLLAAHRGLADFRGEGSLRAWLFGIARRRCARALERQSAQRPVAELLEPPPDAVELLEARRRAEMARALLAEVRPSEREALVLRYVGELSFREVGEACGIDEATARKRVSRALARLRELSEE